MADEKRKHGLWWWIDRYRKSTAYTDMSLAEQGAYRNLLDEQRIRGGFVPNDERILAKVCGDALAWPDVREKVLARFETTPDGKQLFNRTATEVNAVTDALSMTRAESGRRGYEKVERGAGGQFTGKVTGKPSGKATGTPSGKGTGSVAVSVAVVRSPLPLSVADPTTDTSQPAGAGARERGSDLARYGVPGEGEALRSEVKAALAEASAATRRPQDELLVEASSTDRGSAITSIDACASLPWLRTTLGKLTAIRLRAQAQARGSPPLKPTTAGEKSLAAAERFMRRGGDADRSEGVHEGAVEVGDSLPATPGRRDVRVLPRGSGSGS
jgi:uncharacterized protein YdaU (DUF1376 family)